MRNRALVALIIVVILVAISHAVNRGPRPETRKARTETPSGELLSFEHRTIPAARADGSVVVSIRKLEVPAGLEEARVYYRTSPHELFRSLLLTYRGGQGMFSAELPGQPLGQTLEYYLSVTDANGVRLTLPESADTGGPGFTLLFGGAASGSLRLFHALFVFSALYLFLLASGCAWDIWSRGRRREDCFPFLLGGILTYVIGAFPLGWTLTKARTGSYWPGRLSFDWGSGTPGAILVLLFWILVLLLVRDRLLGREEPRERVGASFFAALVIIGTLLTFLLYVVPASF